MNFIKVSPKNPTDDDEFSNKPKLLITKKSREEDSYEVLEK